MTERLVVIGGDAAGMSAAAGARRRRTEAELEIVAFEKGQYTSFAACGIPYLVGGEVESIDRLIARSPEEHRERGVDVQTGHEVMSIDTEAKTVTVRDLAAHSVADEVVSYDQLVITTGANPVRPPIPGIDARGIYGVQTLEDGIAVRDAVEKHAPKRAIVIGAGYIGIEMAEALLMRDVAVTCITAGPAPMPSFDLDMSELISEAMRSLGIDLHLDESILGFDVADDGHVQAVETAKGTYPTDLVVLGIGSHPNVELAKRAGITIGPTGGIATDDHQRTSAPDVFAAGDCVETHHLVTGQPVAIALGTHANKQGRVVGINTTGGNAVFPGVIGTAVSKICKYEVGRTGLSEAEAIAAGLKAFPTVVDSSSRASYYPQPGPLKVKLVTEMGTGRLLGAQIVGTDGAAKRIDVLATCIWNAMTAEDIISLDLGYAPPFSPVWDPVLVAARVAAAETGADV